MRLKRQPCECKCDNYKINIWGVGDKKPILFFSRCKVYFCLYVSLACNCYSHLYNST